MKLIRLSVPSYLSFARLACDDDSSPGETDAGENNSGGSPTSGASMGDITAATSGDGSTSSIGDTASTGSDDSSTAPTSRLCRKTRRRTSRGVAPMLAFVATAAAATSAHAAEDQHPAITAGETAGICDFPSVVAFSAYDSDGALQGGCTASLVAPRLILTAGHCVDDDAFDTVEFTSDLGDPRAESHAVRVERCAAHPNFSLMRAASDIGYCILEDDAPNVPIISPLMGCEAEILSPGRAIVSVGFGRNASASAGGDGGRGVKRWGEQQIQPLEFLTNNFVTIASPSSACNGDSGGPGLVQFPDGTWRIAGIASTVHPTSGLECGVGNVYEVLHTLIPWVEEDSGIDITPCHDADGTWNPTEACGSFQLDLQDEDAQWDAQCRTEHVSPLSETCGLPWEDPNPPSASSSSGGFDETTGGDTTAETTTGGMASSEGGVAAGTAQDGGGDSESGGAPSQESENPTGCTVGGRSWTGWFGLLALMGLFRRRRAGQLGPNTTALFMTRADRSDSDKPRSALLR